MNKLFTAVARQRRFWDFLREVRFALAALEIGSRTVPLADNRPLLRDLRRAASLYRSE